MFIAVYIKELLFTYECVVVPGLGAFITQYIPAELRGDSSLVPPSRGIGFNASLSEDDGLLISHLCRRLDKQANEMRSLLAREVASIYETLSGGGEYVLEGLGVLNLNRDRQLSFKVLPGANVLLDSFGLAPFSFPPLEVRRQSFWKSSILFRKPVSRVREALPGTVVASISTHHAGTYTMVAVLIVFLLTLIPDNLRITEALFRHPASLGPLPSLIELEPEASDGSSTIVTVWPPAEEVEKADSLPLAIGTYPVIAGSFLQESNARELEAELNRKGNTPRVVQTPDHFYRVILGEYSSLTEAEQRLEELRRENTGLDLWILK